MNDRQSKPANEARNSMRILALYLYLMAALPPTVLAQESMSVFDIHFAVITKNPAAHERATVEQLRKEVDILNRFFVDEDRRPVVKFRFKSAALYDELKDSSCDFVRLGDTRKNYDSDAWADMFNACDDPRVRDPAAINFFIYDSHSREKGFGDATCHGKRNSNRPYLLIDWERLDHTDQGPEEHEMGHAFGLDHVFVDGAGINDSTNIMASRHKNGSGGRRNIGFNKDQVRIILEYAGKIQKKLRNTK